MRDLEIPGVAEPAVFISCQSFTVDALRRLHRSRGHGTYRQLHGRGPWPWWPELAPTAGHDVFRATSCHISVLGLNNISMYNGVYILYYMIYDIWYMIYYILWYIIIIVIIMIILLLYIYIYYIIYHKNSYYIRRLSSVCVRCRSISPRAETLQRRERCQRIHACAKWILRASPAKKSTRTA